MSKVYGQKPTSPISASQRYDELSGSVANQDSDLSRQQAVAQSGETLPLVHAYREGGKGGAWVSPPLIGFGLDDQELTLMYVISEGESEGIDFDRIFIGNEKLKDIDEDIEVGTGYEQLPDGMEIFDNAGTIANLRSSIEVVTNVWGGGTSVGPDDEFGYDEVYFTSSSGECTGMDFVLHSGAWNWVWAVAVWKRSDGTELPEDPDKVILIEDGEQDEPAYVHRVRGLDPDRYVFAVYLALPSGVRVGMPVNKPFLSVMATIEHYIPDEEEVKTPKYDNMTLFGIKGKADHFLPRFSDRRLTQMHGFVSKGMKVDDVRDTLPDGDPTSMYANLVNYLLLNSIKIDEELIDRESMALIANMNHRYRMFYNGVLQTTTNFQEWIFKTAPYFWASPSQHNGKYGLTPVVPLNPDGSVKVDGIVPKQTLSFEHIVEGSYNMVMESSKEREDFCCLMNYKTSKTGKVAKTMTVEVRFKDSALNGPYETHDMTEFCVVDDHAIRAAMYILARRRYVTHTLSVTVKQEPTQVNPNDIINLDIEIEGGTKNKYFYQVDSVSEGPDGLVSLALTHFPVNDQNQSLIALAMTQELDAVTGRSRSISQDLTNDLFTWR